MLSVVKRGSLTGGALLACTVLGASVASGSDGIGDPYWPQDGNGGTASPTMT